jgi:hypothetical protein
MQRALVLFAHGARAASWAAPFERLRELTRRSLPDVAVSLAFLELMTPRLPDEVARWSRAACARSRWCRCSWGRAGTCCATCRCWSSACAPAIPGPLRHRARGGRRPGRAGGHGGVAAAIA